MGVGLALLLPALLLGRTDGTEGTNGTNKAVGTEGASENNETSIDNREVDNAARQSLLAQAPDQPVTAFPQSKIENRKSAIPPLATLRPPASPQWDDASCLKCHGDPAIATMPENQRRAMVATPSPGMAEARGARPADYAQALYLDKDAPVTGAHGGAGRDAGGRMRCIDCHAGINSIPHSRVLPRAGCGACHPGQEQDYLRGSHGRAQAQGHEQAPSCASCHGPIHHVRSAADRASPIHTLNIPNTCGGCHAKVEAAPSSGHGGAQWVADYGDSIHGRGVKRAGLVVSAVCSDCHGSHLVLPGSDPQSRTAPQNIPAVCGECHTGVELLYRDSVHGAALASGRGPHCGTCHSSHRIRPVEDQAREVFMLGTVESCGDCHAAQLRTYRDTYHGKVTSLGGAAVALCADCHSAHDVRRGTDPQSPVAPANLLATCRKCHPRAEANFALYRPHPDHRDRARYPVFYWTWLLMTGLLVSVLAGFLAHTAFWFVREIADHARRGIPLRRPRHAAPERLFSRYPAYHRVTHLLVIVSFMGLAATGLPLKYADHPWAYTAMSAVGGYQVAGVIHRFCAILTFVYVALHLGWLARRYVRWPPPPIGWGTLRAIFGPNSMVLRWKDVKDAVGHLRWFLFLGSRPRFDRWTYWDKADYWGEFWGVTVIGSTGLLLWFPGFFSHFMPGWIFNIATIVHSIEALLATCVIFLVHFFNVHLRPSKFPLDEVIFSGALSEAELKEEHPLEYERLAESGELEQHVVSPPSRRFRRAYRIFGIAAFAFGLFLVYLIVVAEWEHLFE